MANDGGREYKGGVIGLMDRHKRGKRKMIMAVVAYTRPPEVVRD